MTIKLPVMLIGDSRTKEFKSWSLWMNEAARISKNFAQIKDDCFCFNETASVSILASAAAKAGLLSIAEYIITKKDKTDRRKKRTGRCDLWISDNDRSWAFEFKQFTPYQLPRKSTLRGKLKSAHRDASQVDHNEATCRYGVLIINSYNFKTENDLKTLSKILDEFISEADYVWKIDSTHNHKSYTYFYFKKF